MSFLFTHKSEAQGTFTLTLRLKSCEQLQNEAGDPSGLTHAVKPQQFTVAGSPGPLTARHGPVGEGMGGTGGTHRGGSPELEGLHLYHSAELDGNMKKCKHLMG